MQDSIRQAKAANRHGASCPTISMAPVLAITSLVARTLLYRPFDPVGEFFKPFVTGPNRILISTEEDRDEDGQNAVAKSQVEEGTSDFATAFCPSSSRSSSVEM